MFLHLLTYACDKYIEITDHLVVEMLKNTQVGRYNSKTCFVTDKTKLDRLYVRAASDH